MSKRLYWQLFIVIELLVWLKASGFWHTINNGPSPKIFSIILLLLGLMEILQLWFRRKDLHALQQGIDGVDVGPPQNTGCGFAW